MTEASLYERLGGEDGLRAIAADVVDAHRVNPVIAPRFKHSDVDDLKRLAFEFFANGSGGPQTYTGRSMPEAHAALNVNEEEFVATCDDVLDVLRKHNIGEREQNEVLGIFFALKGDVLHQ